MTLPARILLPLLAFLALVFVACDGGEPEAPSTPTGTGTPESRVDDEPGRDASPAATAVAEPTEPAPATPTSTATGTTSAMPTSTPAATAQATEPAPASPTSTATETATAAPAPTPTPTPTPALAESAPASPTATLPGEAVPVTGALREMLDDVAIARGLDPPTDLRVRTFAAEEVVEVYTGRFSEEQREALEAGGALYQLLGYVEPGETLWDVTVSTAAHVAGFYSFGDRTLWVASEEEGVDFEGLSAEERHTLAHEMVHAIQDYHFNLRESGRGASTIDARLAWTSVVEGDAVLHTTAWEARFALDAGGAVPVGHLLALANRRQPAELPPAILRAFIFPYVTGPVAVQAIIDREGAEAANALFADPPPGTSAIIQSDLLGGDWRPEADIARLLPASAIADSLGPEWTEVESGVLGQFHLMNYLLGDRLGYPWPAQGYADRRYTDAEVRVQRAGEGWRGDYYRIFERGEDQVLIAVVRFETTLDSSQFGVAHRASLAGGQVAADSTYTLVTRDDGYVVARIAPVGRTVFFAIGTSAEVARAALAPLVEG
ncbi:MAG: hypothetical protein OXE43_09995 [Chloroflexi bacterium]|nr:hypothetical protein [Chloroflexota bacterium]